MDERIKTLARNLVNYSCKVKKGDKVYVHYIGEATEDLARQLVKAGVSTLYEPEGAAGNVDELQRRAAENHG